MNEERPASEARPASDEYRVLSAKERMAIDRQAMPEQDPDARAVNFQELADRLTTYQSFEQQALDRLGACATTEVKS